jgi:hypothetical protein
MTHGLSKSRILDGLQCPKRLWLAVHHPELTRYSQRSLQSFQAGIEAQEAYRKLIPNGILVEHVDDSRTALEETCRIMVEDPGAPIFEPAFQHKGVLVRADLMLPSLEGYRMVEIKASASVKDGQVKDCAIQTWLIERAGIAIKTAELAVINNTFVYPGAGNYYGLFKHEDVTERVRILMRQVPDWARDCRTVLKSAMPDVRTGDQCSDPYECPFIEHCSEGEPTYPVRSLPGRKNVARALEAEGIFDIRDIPEGKLSRPVHTRVARITKSGKAEINPNAKAVLKQFPYPRYYLDFETISFTIPIWPGTRPFQQIPFQWSCHVEHNDGRIEHLWFLDTSGEMPARGAAESLVQNLGKKGPIFMYAPFERRVINDLIGEFSDLAPQLKRIGDRLVDLRPIVKENYYHPDMKGSWSLKAVTASMAPEMSHAKLGEVADGTAAQRAYVEIIAPGTDRGRRGELRKKLLEYCGLDTRAMVRIAHELQGL